MWFDKENVFYIVGGFDSKGEIAECECYNLQKKDEWICLPISLQVNATTILNNHLYSIGGHSHKNGGWLKTIFRLNMKKKVAWEKR